MHKKSFYIAAAVLIAAAVVYSISAAIFEQESAKEAISVLSDAFFVPGALLAGFGALSWISSEGLFDMLSYSFTRFGLHTIIPGTHQDKPEDFYEYKLKKDEKRKKNGWLKEVFFVGLAGIAVSVVFLVVYSVL